MSGRGRIRITCAAALGLVRRRRLARSGRTVRDPAVPGTGKGRGQANALTILGEVQLPGWRNALDEAIAPLLELAAPLRTGAQRDALAAYVIRKLHSAWNTRNPRAAGNRGTLS